MEMGKSKVLIKFLRNFRQSGDVLFFLNVRRLRGYTATFTTFFLKSLLSSVNKNGRLYQMEIKNDLKNDWFFSASFFAGRSKIIMRESIRSNSL